MNAATVKTLDAMRQAAAKKGATRKTIVTAGTDFIAAGNGHDRLAAWTEANRLYDQKFVALGAI